MVSIINLLLWPVFVYWRAYAVAILWGWFVFPPTGIPTPSIYTLAGLLLVASAMLPRNTGLKPNDQLAFNIAFPLICLGFGWLWHWLQWGV